MNLKSVFLGIVASLGIFLVFYFSWLPNPDIGLKSYFPIWLGKWTNRNPNLRTAVPFVFLGLFGELLLIHNEKSLFKRSLIFICLIAIVTLAELGQLLLPMRHFDIRDIGWGAFGSAFGIGLGLSVKSLKLI